MSSWADKIELQVFDPRFIGRNLLEWFKQNQTDALAWAGDGVVLPPVKNFFPNLRTVTNFPSLVVMGMDYDTETDDDIATVTLTLEYQVGISHGKEDWLAENAPKYAMAFESMTKNVLKTSLEKDSKINFEGVHYRFNTRLYSLDRLKTNAFIQTFSTQTTWICVFGNNKEANNG